MDELCLFLVSPPRSRVHPLTLQWSGNVDHATDAFAVTVIARENIPVLKLPRYVEL